MGGGGGLGNNIVFSVKSLWHTRAGCGRGLKPRTRGKGSKDRQAKRFFEAKGERKGGYNWDKGGSSKGDTGCKGWAVKGTPNQSKGYNKGKSNGKPYQSKGYNKCYCKSKTDKGKPDQKGWGKNNWRAQETHQDKALSVPLMFLSFIVMFRSLGVSTLYLCSKFVR